MNRLTQLFMASLAAFSYVHSSLAATPVDLRHTPDTILQSLASPTVQFKMMSSHTDFNQVQHMRIQQTYMGHRVWGSDAVVHIAKGQPHTMNGVVYQGLQADLAKTPAYALNNANSARAVQEAMNDFTKQNPVQGKMSAEQPELIVYVDDQHVAHWAYHVRMSGATVNQTPVKPYYILDAVNFHVYKKWDNIQTDGVVSGGGFGGNTRMGKISYDGTKESFQPLTLTRNDSTKTCSLMNNDVTVRDDRHSSAIVQFSCKKASEKHNNLYWDSALDSVNGAYAPSNDALYDGEIIKKLYQDWYGVPVLVKDGKPMMLTMVVHKNMENAYWDGSKMVFGDGGTTFYPLTSLGVGAHEISHGFTEQHSGLVYTGQSGGLNESFSDMAAQAAEFYMYKHNSWQIGPEIFKAKHEALRYMKKPSTDCHGGTPGNWCSIDKASQYKSGIDVHFSSGVFNRLFYLIGSAANWDVHKAFDVMVKANEDYWTSDTSFADAACGVVKATKDYNYDMTAVTAAMKKVDIKIDKC